MELNKVQKIKLGVGIGLGVLFAFTVDYLMRQIRLLVNTDFEMVGTNIGKLSLSEINITLWWKVINKSDISFTITEQVYNVFLNGQFIKKIIVSQPVVVRSKSDSRIPTPIVFEPKDLLKIEAGNMSRFLTEAGRKTLKLQVRGHMSVKTSVFNVKKFPIEYTDTIENIKNY